MIISDQTGSGLTAYLQAGFRNCQRHRDRAPGQMDLKSQDTPEAGAIPTGIALFAFDAALLGFLLSQEIRFPTSSCATNPSRPPSQCNGLLRAWQTEQLIRHGNSFSRSRQTLRACFIIQIIVGQTLRLASGGWRFSPESTAPTTADGAPALQNPNFKTRSQGLSWRGRVAIQDATTPFVMLT
jgi:hypothetical protein